MTPHLPNFVDQANTLAKDARSEKLAMIYTGLAVSVMALIAVKEIRELFRDRDHHRHFSDDHRCRTR